MDSYGDMFGTPDGPVFTDLRELEVRPIRWLDKPFLPWGELVVMSGDGGVGKGLFSVHQAARISRLPGMVVFATAEDNFTTVLKPRLIAAGADLRFVRCLSWQRQGTADALKIPDDVPGLEHALRALHTHLLVIDPLLSHLSSGMDSYRDHEVKRALLPLLNLAQRTGCLVLGNHHMAKNKSYGLRNAVMGSVAFVTSPRVALAMTASEDDETLRTIEIVKSNIGGIGITRDYRIKATAVPGLWEEQPVMAPDSFSFS